MAIPSAKRVLETSYLSNMTIRLGIEQRLTTALDKPLDIKEGKPFDIIIDALPEHRGTIEDLLVKAGYRVVSIHYSTWRNETSATIRLSIPPQAE